MHLPVVPLVPWACIGPFGRPRCARGDHAQKIPQNRVIDQVLIRAAVRGHRSQKLDHVSSTANAIPAFKRSVDLAVHREQ